MQNAQRKVVSLFCLLLLLPFSLLHAQKLEVKGPSEVDLSEEYFQISYTIGTDKATGFGVAIKDFDVLFGPSTSVSQMVQSINGRTTRQSSITYTYTLRPEKKGTFTIPAAHVTVGGRTIQSRTLTIRVTDSGKPRSSSSSGSSQSSGGGEKLRAMGSHVTANDLYIRAQLSRTTVYEQEPVVLTYQFYERPGVGLNSVALTSKPDFKGLVTNDIPQKGIDITTARVGGQTLRTGTVQKYVIYPQKAGTLTIPPVTFDCVVIQRDNTIDPLDLYFNGGGNIGVKMERTAPAVTLTVRPLPQPAPKGFCGGIGSFTVKRELTSADVRSNDLATIKITVEGTGNLKMIKAPTIAFPTDFDSYTPKSTDNTSVTTKGESGSITWEYTFVPRNKGNYTLPALDFAFFDPSTGKYVEKQLPPLQLNVKEGTKTNAEADYERQLRNSDISNIITGPVSAAREWWGTAACIWSFLGLLLLFAALNAVLIYVRKHREGEGSKQRASKRTFSKQLRQFNAMCAKHQEREAFAFLDKALDEFLQRTTSLERSEQTVDSIAQRLSDMGCTEDVVDEYRKVREELALVQYAPLQTIDADALSQRVADLVDHIAVSTKKRGSTKQSATSSSSSIMQTFLLALILSVASAFSAQAAAPDFKTRGDSAYAARDFAKAAQMYRQTLRQQSNEVLYYNLGNAYFRQDDYVNAIASYERALRLKPNFEDADRNLRICQSRLNVVPTSGGTMFFISWADGLMRHYSADRWGAFCLAAFALLLLLATIVWQRKPAGAPRRLLHIGIGAAILLCVFCATTAVVQYNRLTQTQMAVVKTDLLLDGNSSAGKGATIRRGTTVIVEQTAPDGRAYVRTKDGQQEGWGSAASLLKL